MNSTREMHRESNLTTEVQEGNMKKIIQVMCMRRDTIKNYCIRSKFQIIEMEGRKKKKQKISFEIVWTCLKIKTNTERGEKGTKRRGRHLKPWVKQ